MTTVQQIITIGAVVIGTVITRFLPFLIFPPERPTPFFIKYIGKVLPGATFGLLLIYSLKSVSLLTYPYALPEILSSLVIIALHLWKRQMLISIAGGTLVYMFLVQLIF